MTRPSKPPFLRTLMVVAPFAVVLAVVLIAVNQSTPMPSTPAGSGGASTAAVGAAIGSPNAPVKMDAYSDFQCPFCRMFATDTEKRIFSEYVTTGKVYFTYKHFIVIGAESVAAAQSAECAGKQGQFWQYHDKLFAGQAGDNQGAFATANLKRWARDLKLDGAAFDKCLDGEEFAAKGRNDSQEAANRGARSTPTFFINGQMVAGAQPFDAFKKVIDASLSQ